MNNSQSNEQKVARRSVIAVIGSTFLIICVCVFSHSVTADSDRNVGTIIFEPFCRLTAVEAHEALVRMLRRDADPEQDAMGNHFHSIDVNVFITQTPRLVRDDWYAVGPFAVDLSTRKYEIEFGGKCTYHYTGQFVREVGRWQAVLPEYADWIACSK
jgi:hypothetical protein